MARKVWTRAMDRTLCREYPVADPGDLAGLASRLGVTPCALKSRANRLGSARRRPWTPGEDETLRRLHGVRPMREIARLTGRTLKQVWGRARRLGLPRLAAHLVVSPAFLDRVRELNARGLSDSDVAAELGCGRHTASGHRRRMGLPDNSRGPLWRERLRASGTLIGDGGATRRDAYRVFARRHGWPEHLPPRAVQVLDLLASVGLPLTRRQIAEAAGLRWVSSRKAFSCKGPGGSYLALLAAEGLVLRLKRAHRVTGRGKGRTCDLYCLGPAALEILAARAAGEEACGTS